MMGAIAPVDIEIWQMALAFLLGDVWVQQWTRLPSAIEWTVLALFALLSWRSRHAFWLALLVGVLWASAFGTWRLQHRLAGTWLQRDVSIEGYIATLGRYDDERVGFDFVVTEAPEGIPGMLRLNWYHPRQPVIAGQRWTLTVKLKPPHGRLNPGGFDYETWLFANGIGATGYVRDHPTPQILDGASYPGQWLAAWRQAIADRIESLLPDSPYLGVIQALTLGHQQKITPDQWRVFRVTGVVHLIVISGSHISLVSGLVFFLARKLWASSGNLRHSPHTVAALVAGCFACVYAALAGFSIPTQRALVMLSVVLLALIRQRHVGALQTLSLALLAVLGFDPLAVLSVGFWLSFTAVAVLLYAATGRLKRSIFWREAVQTQWVAAVGLSPLLIACFQQLSLISPLANWMAVPWVGLLIVPLCLLASLLSYVSSTIATALFHLIDWQLDVLYTGLSAMAAWPWAMISIPEPRGYAVVFCCLGVVLMLAPRGIPGRLPGMLLCVPLLFPRLDKPRDGEAWLTLLDVGQGLAVVIQTARHIVVFDTGARYSEQSDMGESVLLPHLLYRGARMIDHLIISHGDNDHSGGASAVLASLPVAQVSSSVSEFAEGSGRNYCRAGQQWQWDEVMFTMLAPSDHAFAKENDNSCVLKVAARDWSVLLTGDIEQTAEAWLVEHQAMALPSTILIAPHHGSKTSSSMTFLRAVAPEMILIPAGHLNRFGFPHRDVLERYQRLHMPWRIQGEQGAIRILSHDGGWLMTSERTLRSRYWMQPVAAEP